MRLLSNLSIKHKLVVTIAGTSLVLSLLTLIISATLDIKQAKENVLNNAKLEAKLIGEYSRVSLSFRDTIWAVHVLEKIESMPSLLSGHIYDTEGNVFAKYYRNGIQTKPTLDRSNSFLVKENIVDSLDTIGTIVLNVSTKQITDRISFYSRMGIFIAIALVFLSWLLANYFQSFFSKPISNLAKVAKEVSKDEDYTKRVYYDSKDELGILYSQFNGMLEKIYISQKELVKNRSFLNNIIDSMPSILISIDAKGNITRLNNKAEEITRMSRDEAEGNSVSELFPNYSAYLEEIKLTIKNKKSISKTKIKNISDGQIVDMTAYPLIANGIQGAVIRIDDVTEKVRLEEMMVQTEKMMSVGGLAAGMAHEINNPLGIIAQGAQNILQKTNPEIKANIKAAEALNVTMEQLQQYFNTRHIPEFISDIREATSRAASIVSNMLKFSRKSTSDKKLADIKRIIDNTINLVATDYDLKKKYDFKNIEIVKEYAKDIPEISVCETEIEQVLLNLFKNGAQAMYANTEAEHKHKFIVRLSYDTANLKIEVEDNGPGMPEEVRKRIFEPFYTTKPIGVGTGLGLSVSYMIVANYHNGNFKVDSTLGEGTNFIIELPF